MKHRKEWLIGCATVGLLWAILTKMGELSWLTTPLWLLGDGLRNLSLHGGIANGGAWAILLTLAGIPVIYMGFRKVKGRKTACDWLLPVISLQIGALLYFLVNPTLAKYPGDIVVPDGFALIYTGGLVATGIGYLLLRILNRITMDATSGTQLPLLLQIGGFLLAGLTTYNHVALLLSRIQTVQTANTGDVSFTVVVLSVIAFFQWIPAVLGGVTLLLGGDVATALMMHPYGDGTIALCHKVAKWCNRVAVLSICVSIVCNLMQIVLASQLFQSNITVELPLLTLLLSSALYLLCHYCHGAKSLADDNESII